MEDIYFSRIGLAFQHILTVVELPDHLKTEVDALSTELQTFEGSINGLIDQRVQARLDQIDGAALGGLAEANAKITALADRMTALESGVETLADDIDPPVPPIDPATPVDPAPPADTATGSDTGTATVAGGAGDDTVADASSDDTVTGGTADDSVGPA